MTKTNYINIKSTVRICLFLAMFFVFQFFLTLVANAESTTKLYLNNEKINLNKNLRLQTVNLFPNCSSLICFKRPNDFEIASDGSFVIVSDSSNSGEKGINLRRFNFNAAGFLDGGSIPLLQKGSEAPLLSVLLSQNNKKAAIYREPIKTEDTLVQIVDLSNNSVKELKSITATSKDTQIGIPAFIDTEGKKLLAGTLNTPSSLLTIDTETDQVTNKLSLPDTVQSITVTPDFTKAIITYNETAAQSVSIYNINTGFLSRLTIDQTVKTLVDDFLGLVKFDSSGKKAVVSSLDGNHVVHLLDLENNKLRSQILDKVKEGPTLSTITPDGKTIISVGSLFDEGLRVYKTTIQRDGSITLPKTALFLDGSILLDVDISPDQNKIFILVLKDNKKQLKILSLKDLTLISDVNISNDNGQSFIQIDPNGRYAITQNTNIEPSISVIQDLSSGPILRSINPNNVQTGLETNFVISGFINTATLSDTKVCFGNPPLCSSNVVVSSDGLTISGTTPKFIEPGLLDLILSAKSNTGEPIKVSKYEDIFQVKKGIGIVAVVDNVIPEITILSPQDLKVFNTTRILVLGKADGTGSQIESVTVNGKPAILNSGNVSSSNIVNFSVDIEFSNNGNNEIKIIAKDKANNTNEKIVKVAIDTINPTIIANVEAIDKNQFKVTGTANGTGSSISSILINNILTTFTENQEVVFSSTTNTQPVKIIVSDKAGNKNELTIANSQAQDKTPPVINIATPTNGQVFKDKNNIQVLFTVTDDTSIRQVLFNDMVSTSANSNYSESIVLKPGQNLVSISATDINDNSSSTKIIVVYAVPEEKTNTTNISTTNSEPSKEKEVISLPNDFKDLGTALIDQFSDLAEGGKLVDIGSTLSVEVANPPPIPEGKAASIDIPSIRGIQDSVPGKPQDIPKGFSLATSINFSGSESDTEQITDEEKNSQNVALLVDSRGRAFIVGFAFFKKPNKNSLLQPLRTYRFQTTEGEPLELITTFTVPGDATEGDVQVSIINKSKSLATIPLRIGPSKDVKVGKKNIGQPQIKDPVVATLQKSGRELLLRVQGNNFIGKIATIDGKLERLIGKANSFTNVTFTTGDGIKIKRLKLLNNKSFLLIAELDKDFKGGVRFFNVITPKGADIGGIVFPEKSTNGKLQTTTSPVSLILNTPGN